MVIGLLAGTYSAIGASWLVAAGSAVTTIVLVLVLREGVVRIGPAPSLRAVLPGNRQAAVPGALLLLGYLVLGVGMRRDSMPPVWPGQVTVWVMYAIVAGLHVLTLRSARTLPLSLVGPQGPSSRRPLFALGIAFSVAAVADALVPAAAWVATASTRTDAAYGLCGTTHCSGTALEITTSK